MEQRVRELIFDDVAMHSNLNTILTKKNSNNHALLGNEVFNKFWMCFIAFYSDIYSAKKYNSEMV